MEKYFDINAEGFSVRCKLFYEKDFRHIPHVAICTHGFGGNKENRSAAKFAEHYITKYSGCGVIVFDWPCHGADARKKLVLDEFMTYLRLVTDYARNHLGAEEVFNYSASFGAYLTLLYIHKYGNPFRRIALRCPGINMYQLMLNNLSPEDIEKVKKGKDVSVGYERKMKLDRDFLEDLKTNDIRKYEYFDWADDMLILHGTKDRLAPIEDAGEFAENNVITFIPVENANHTFSDPKTSDFAAHTVVEFFKPQK